MIKKQSVASKYYLFLLISLFIYACTGSSENTGNTTSDNTEQNDQATENQPANTDASEDGIFKDMGEIGLNLSTKGKINQVIRWKEGENTKHLLISSSEKGEVFTPTWESKIFLDLYQEDQLLDSYEDKARNTYSGVFLIEGMSEIISFGGGAKGPVIAYSICPDGDDPCILHVSAFAEGKKYDLERMADVEEANFKSANAEALGDIPEAIRTEMLITLFDQGFEQ